MAVCNISVIINYDVINGQERLQISLTARDIESQGTFGRFWLEFYGKPTNEKNSWYSSGGPKTGRPHGEHCCRAQPCYVQTVTFEFKKKDFPYFAV